MLTVSGTLLLPLLATFKWQNKSDLQIIVILMQLLPVQNDLTFVEVLCLTFLVRIPLFLLFATTQNKK